MTASGDASALVQEGSFPEEKTSDFTASLPNEKESATPGGDDAEANVVDHGDIGEDNDNDESSWLVRHRSLVRRVRLFALAALIFGWWISSTLLPATRHRWIVQTLFAWLFIAIIAFRFIPNSVVTRPVEAV